MQFMSNGFNMSKIGGSTHVPCWELKRCQKNHQPIIMHYVNKIIWYFNFHINNLKLLIFLKRVQIIFISEQHNECNNYEQY